MIHSKVFGSEDEDKGVRPVMIHRTVLGSFERMLAILLDHYKGKWPFWISPRQVIVCSSSNNENHRSYAEEVLQSWLHSSLWVLAVTWRVLSLPFLKKNLFVIIQTGEKTDSWSWLPCWCWHNRQKHQWEGNFYKVPGHINNCIVISCMHAYFEWWFELFYRWEKLRSRSTTTY